MSLKPLKGIVIVEPEDRTPEKTDSGIYIKSNYQGAPQIGKVYAIGAGIKDIKVGDRVIFNEPNPNGFKHKGIGYLPLKEEQIAAILND